jgi:hypothetical protein
MFKELGGYPWGFAGIGHHRMEAAKNKTKTE